MKKISLILMLITMGIINHTYAQDRILVAYYSWSGNTEALAKAIHEKTGGDIFVIDPVKAYPEDYTDCVNQAKTEINAGAKPEIKGTVDISKYDIIILGTPNWWSTMAPPVLTFLSDNDFKGKKILPFVTHGGGREARCFSDMRKTVSGAEFAEGLVVSGARAKNSGSEIDSWLAKVGIPGK